MNINKVFSGIMQEAQDWFETILIRWMPGRIGKFVRRVYWGFRLQICGKVSIDEGCVIEGPEGVSIGKGVHILRNRRKEPFRSANRRDLKGKDRFYRRYDNTGSYYRLNASYFLYSRQ